MQIWSAAVFELSCLLNFLSESMDNSAFGIPEQLLATLRILNLDPDNLKWMLTQNKQRVLLKLVWGNRPQQHTATQSLSLGSLLRTTWIAVTVMEQNCILPKNK